MAGVAPRGRAEEAMRNVPLLLLPLAVGACVSTIPITSITLAPPSEKLTRRESIREVIGSHREEIRDCYLQALRTRGSIPDGKVVVRFGILADGTVKECQVEFSSMDSPMLERCVQDRVLTWVFPREDAPRTTIVTYPFLFVRNAPEAPKPPPAATQ
ncbi:AgmX/PglI C-terminal domain-containing protein [Archangium violaceum]|nr:AgmX/PglI C-terminal domain-containing protein [Archangium violaceum]